MNKLLMYPLIIMAILALFNQFYYYSNKTISFNGTSQTITSSGEIIQNGTSTSIGTGNASMVFDLNTTGVFIALVVGVVSLASVLGISFLGSGISERAQRIIFNSVVCYGFWGIFSSLLLTLLLLIPVFGLILLIAMTFIYTLGFFKRIEEKY